MAKGRKGNRTGNLLERTLESVLTQKGFEVINYRQWEKNIEKHGTELLLKNAPFTTVYKHSGNTEYLLLSQKYDLRIRIECKWQQVSGSVDEKLPYLYLNCIEAMPEKNVIILIDGDGWKLGAIAWLKEAVKFKKYTTPDSEDKKIEIYNLKETLTWANNTFEEE